MTPALLDGVRFAWSARAPLFDDLTLRLEPGWTGLVGPNGCGKSTLLGLILGDPHPQAGRVRLPGPAVLCAQRLEPPDPAVAALAARRDRVAARVRGQLGLDPARLGPELRGWPTLSGGEARRWQVGAALAQEPAVLLVDEPTNHLDAPARDWLVRALRAWRGVGLLVSHDRELLDALTTRTVRLEGGQAQVLPLPYSEAQAVWSGERAAREATREEQARALRRAQRQLQAAREVAAQAEAARSRRRVDPRDHDARSMGRKQLAAWGEAAASSAVARRREAVARAEVHTLPPEPELGRALTLGWTPCPRPVLAAWQGPLCAGDRLLLPWIEVQLGRQDRLWLSGPNGAGKSTLLRALLPTDRPVLVLPQVLSEQEAAADLHALRALPPDARGRTLQLAAALGVPAERLLGTARASPGEARKLRLALGLGAQVEGLFLDEPTNDLDLPSVERLERALVAFPGAIALVTHDRRLAEALGARELRLPGGGVSKGVSNFDTPLSNFDTP